MLSSYFTLFGLALITIFQDTCSAKDTYSAVVVEYSPSQDPSIDPSTNILLNVMNYGHITNIANENFLPDIIVFPEIGLKGYGNQEQYLFIPDPDDKVRPCAYNTTYEAPLVQLSCIARATETYLVVNLGEKYFNISQQKNVYFNTDVVFDSTGTIIVRYRKIHLYGETGKSPSPNKELAYFDTNFGVRFGIFTCFDIIFEDPGVILANEFNITHFIFPTAWFSEMPFLTAIQEQFYWSYSQDVVLLASGYNDPSVGSSGTGIYLGRRGPVAYNMSEARQTFMLQADVPKKLRSGLGTEEGKELLSEILILDDEMEETKSTFQDTPENTNKIKLKLEKALKMYTNKSIIPPESPIHIIDGRSFYVDFTVNENICQNSLCCVFDLAIRAVFSKSHQETTRGDDYSQMFYRLAVFDGVRDYDRVDYGGVQVCAIIPCANSDHSSCGLRSDDVSAKPNMLLGFYQTGFVFHSITIRGDFSTNHSFVGPNILLTGQGENFGSLLPSESFKFYEAHPSRNGTQVRSFKTLEPISNLVTASLYGRIFSRDGETDQTVQSRAFSSLICLTSSLIICFTSVVLVCN
ncbi:vanin-like protein 1 [Macrosteles quadrilineatus]|uniref:vanin-like protein 1 n=1 Tax=Macrosteles quadrilineatus TaxID=74068 RepID=UPI0023E34186|nr:vanin-like protein 1 [Macrosteles quadrilineatus]